MSTCEGSLGLAEIKNKLKKTFVFGFRKARTVPVLTPPKTV